MRALLCTMSLRCLHTCYDVRYSVISIAIIGHSCIATCYSSTHIYMVQEYLQEIGYRLDSDTHSNQDSCHFPHLSFASCRHSLPDRVCHRGLLLGRKQNGRNEAQHCHDTRHGLLLADSIDSCIRNDPRKLRAGPLDASCSRPLLKFRAARARYCFGDCNVFMPPEHLLPACGLHPLHDGG